MRRTEWKAARTTQPMALRCDWQSCAAGRESPNGRRSEIARARPRRTRSSCSRTSMPDSSKRPTGARRARPRQRLARRRPPHPIHREARFPVGQSYGPRGLRAASVEQALTLRRSRV